MDGNTEVGRNFKSLPEKRNTIEVRERLMSCAMRWRKEKRHAVSKIRKAVRMKIMVKYIKECNIAAVKNRLKVVSHRKVVDKMKTLDFTIREHSKCNTLSMYM